MGVAGEWFIGVTLKVEYSVVDSYREGAVVLIVDADDGPFQPDTATTRTTLHLLFRLKNQTQKRN